MIFFRYCSLYNFLKAKKIKYNNPSNMNEKLYLSMFHTDHTSCIFIVKSNKRTYLHLKKV